MGNILKAKEEDMLRVLLKEYDRNDKLEVGGSYDIFPEYMRFSIKATLDNLKYAGIIASASTTMNRWQVNLTPDAINYFHEKERNRRNNFVFTKLPTLLKRTLNEAKRNVEGKDYFDANKCLNEDGSIIKYQMFTELERLGYIRTVADGGLYQLEAPAFTYDEYEAEYERQLKSVDNSTTNYNFHDVKQAIVASGSNSTINANQYNTTDIEQLKSLIADVRQNIPKDISEENLETLNDSLEVIEYQSAQIEPKKSFIRTAVNGLKELVSKLNGVEGATKLLMSIDLLIKTFKSLG